MKINKDTNLIAGFLLLEVILAMLLSAWVLYPVVMQLNRGVGNLNKQYAETVVLVGDSSLHSALKSVPAGAPQIFGQLLNSWESNWPHVLNTAHADVNCGGNYLPCMINLHWHHLGWQQYKLTIGVNHLTQKKISSSNYVF
jgi:hypothetical protein